MALESRRRRNDADRKRPAGAPAPAGQEVMRERGRSLARMRRWSVLASASLLLLGALVGLLFFARPKTSDVEKRDLTAFPEVTPGRLLDGSFFSDLAVWYSDTYPPREALVGASQALQQTYGLHPKTQMVGGNVTADDLPPVGEGASSAAAAADATNAAGTTASSGDANAADASSGGASASAPASGGNSAATGIVSRVVQEVDDRLREKEYESVEIPEARYLQEAIQDKVMAGLYVDGDAAYNVYYFDQESVEQYARAMNTCAANLKGEATVYSILAPTSAAVMLDEDVYESLGGTDQREALRYFLSLYDRDVHGIEVFDTLRAHRDEYIFFRTDHHWTELGAYYAYLEFCKDKGQTPSNILAREKMTFEPFLGTFYAEVGNDAMEANPDHVDAYVPDSTNDMVVWDTDGNEIETNVITDVSSWNVYSGYNCFISGDRPLSRIDNPTKTDGSSCLVIKDSIGCAFVPLLVDDYQTVWVIDFRYSDRSIPAFVRDQGIEDVIFVNSMVLAGTDAVSAALLAQAQ